jgi:hypothetical protein
VSHPLSAAARDRLEAWPVEARQLFEELLIDAPTPLQRELLVRAVAAGHGPQEVHAFADQVRALSDPALYDAVAVSSLALPDATVSQLLGAQGDPLHAFEALGGTLHPRDELWAAPTAELPAMPASPAPLALPLGAPRHTFEADSREVLPVPRPSDPTGLARPAPAAGAPAGGLLAEDLLTEATGALRVGWREADLDAAEGISTAAGLASAAVALHRGIPVPCAIGPGVGIHRRFVVLLQAAVSGPTRAWQLFDPLTRELVWASELDLLAGKELPFANKANRRLTRMVLPIEL